MDPFPISTRAAATALALGAIAFHGIARADLWAYVDEQGRSHVANRQVDSRYTLFFKGETSLDRKGAKARSRRIVKGGPGVAHRTLRMVKAILAHAVREKLIAGNPAQNVHGGREAERDRFLDAKEEAHLARALAAAEREPSIPWQATAAVRLILASGLRKAEALALRWDAIDFQNRRIVLEESKTGRSVRPLSKEAITVLEHVKVRHLSGPWVVPATRGKGRFTGVQKPW